MKEQLILSDKELELIQGIRNYKRSYPNGGRGYVLYLRELFDELLEIT